MSRARDLADGTFSGDFSADSPTFVVDDTNNRVGVGTASPGEPLDVSGNIRALGANSRVLFGPDGFEAGIKYATDASLQIASRTGEPITFTNGHDGTERARIDSSGRLLVGTTSSNYSGGTLQVDGGKVLIRSTDSSYGQFQIGSPGGTEASIAFISNATGFGTAPSSSSGDNAIWAVGSGAYSIGATSWGIGNKGRGTYVAKIAYNSTSWTFSSDERLKNIEGEIENALDKIDGIRAVYFRWKDDEAQQRQVGVIAQEVQAVLPEAVDVPEIDTNEDGTTNYLGVGYTDLIPLLIASVKELNAKVEACEAKNTEQQALIEDLQTRLAALENV